MQDGAYKEMNILTFNLAKEEYGLDISNVYEVLKEQKIHPLPGAPDFVEGVINIRGHIIAVIDLKKKLLITPAAGPQTSRIIVCRVKDFIVGLIVDGANEVLSMTSEQIESTPAVLSGKKDEGVISGIARIGARVITLLDLCNVLTNDEAEKFSRVKS